MTGAEIKILMEKQKRKTLPAKLFIWLNILFAFFTAFYLLVIGIRESSSGRTEQNLTLQILPEPLNEMGEKPGSEDQPNAGQEKPEDEEKPESQNMDEKQRKWLELFNQYSQKITVRQENLIYELIFDLAPKVDLPLNNGDVDVAFEVYDKDKEYLFTFYGNYWNEDGYDEGEYWHERYYSDNTYIQFPYAGDFYLIAGVPGGSPEMIEKLRMSSGSKVNLFLLSNSKPFPVSSIFGFIFFIAAGIILIKIRRFFTGEGKIYPFNFIYVNPDFNQFHFIAEIEGNLYYVNGLSRKHGIHNAAELILDRDGQASFLELEREYEDGEVDFFATFYDVFPEDEFGQIPDSGEIMYKNRSLKKDSQAEKNYKIETFYANGLKEENVKTELYFESKDEYPYILSFEYGEVPEDFDVSYGRPLNGFKFWRIRK